MVCDTVKMNYTHVPRQSQQHAPKPDTYHSAKVKQEKIFTVP